MSSVIIGINAYHGDSAAAILVDGEIVAAVEEERFRRVKHWAGFPSKSIEFCLRQAGRSISEVDIVALNQNPGSRIWKKAAYLFRSRPAPGLVLGRLKNRGKRQSIVDELDEMFPGQCFSGELESIDHHMAHLSSAHHVSPFDSSVAVSIDGFGDFASAAWGIGRDAEISMDDQVYFPHSLGVFYQALTQFLGFHHYGDEYKLMGLAPYGSPEFLPTMRHIVKIGSDGKYELELKYFRHHRKKIAYQWNDGAPVFGRLFSNVLEDLIGPARQPEDELTQRHMNIAHSVQAMYEEAFFALLNQRYRDYGVDRLSLAGGCAMNSVANGKVTLRTPFRSVYVQAAAGDAGGALGAALVAWFKSGGKTRPAMRHAYLGPRFDRKEVNSAVDDRKGELEAGNCLVRYTDDEDELCELAAKAVSEGQVMGWFHGRLEWGPRALGGRSIVGDPRRSDMKDILNRKIKRRESFRPFAPSILREYVDDWFEQDDDVPFMMKVFLIKEAKRSEIPAVTHVDGSGRLQTVSEDDNPLYFKMIENFRQLTGIPMVLNTSFNENEPVVCRPEEALDCFLRTNMDVLVMENVFISRMSRR